MQLKLYEIALPVRDNGGKETAGAMLAFETIALEKVEGYTKRPAGQGAWQGSDGRIYYDDMVPYRIACEAAIWPTILDAAFRLFPDQLALYHAELGVVTITTREAHDHGKLRMAPPGAKPPFYPFELHRVEGVLERARDASRPLTEATWALETAMRNIRVARTNGTIPSAIADLESKAAGACAKLERLL